MKFTQNRLDLLDTVQVDDVDEKDPLSSKFLDFEKTRRGSLHRVLSGETRRPDLLAQREYGSVRLWWFPLKAEGIIDPFALPEGELLGIPSILDFYDFVREQRSI